VTLKIDCNIVQSGYDRKTCWVHARPAVLPGDPYGLLITMQKLRLTGSDVFYEINDLRSDDAGQTWTGPTPHVDTFGRRMLDDGMEECVCDVYPFLHRKTGVVLATGQTVRYINDDHPDYRTPCSTGYSVYDAGKRAWSPWASLQMPDSKKFKTSGAGCTQWMELPDGDILLPMSYTIPGSDRSHFEFMAAVVVARCTFDGRELRCSDCGNEMMSPTGRGFAEPSIAELGGRYYLTLRHDEAGYIATSDDGLHYDEPRLWTFDDGSDLGSYNTQQHWINLGGELYLVYTRRGANNDHIMRHRAPLFIAKVDTERLRVLRDTEQIVVPERGARLGNFGIAQADDNEAWVVVSEWMQTTLPDPYDSTVCEKYGSDNAIFAARVRI
jgi:hypothetical protein